MDMTFHRLDINCLIIVNVPRNYYFDACFFLIIIEKRALSCWAFGSDSFFSFETLFADSLHSQGQRSDQPNLLHRLADDKPLPHLPLPRPLPLTVVQKRCSLPPMFLAYPIVKKTMFIAFHDIFVSQLIASSAVVISKHFRVSRFV